MTIAFKYFPAGQAGFFRAPVLLSGATEAILVDGGFTYADGHALVAAIQESGKKLSAVYVSQGDPDYYFSLKPIQTAFPDARIIAAPGTVAAIQANVHKKLEIWGPKLQENGPQTLSDVVIPTPSTEQTLSLDGETIEIITPSELSNRHYLWVPSLAALFGGVLVFSGVHVWTADTPRPEQREAWRQHLDALALRDPKVVIPGHLASGGPTGVSAISYTREYLLAFEQELAAAADSSALIAAMKRRYPSADMGVALDIGAKVAKGELKWG